jgi:hypothetical protein
MSTYDGRISEDCKQECQQGTCVKTWGDPYGCGGCCKCLGGCYAGHMEQLEQEREGWVRVSGCTCNAPLCGPGSGHESYCGWEQQG